MRGFLIAAPCSGSGKTIASLAIMRAFAHRGIRVQAGKCGPDYIDVQYHEAATGHPSVNLDPWAMEPGLTGKLLSIAAKRGRAKLAIVEGAMGLLDGAGVDGKGSSADLAMELGLPVVLVLDVRGQSHSARIWTAGIRALRPELQIAGVVLNRVGSQRHADLVRTGIEREGLCVFGAIPRSSRLEIESRHLGLRLAMEQADIVSFLDRAARLVSRHLDLDAIWNASGRLSEVNPASGGIGIPPLGQRIAVARDKAFCFVYGEMLEEWRSRGSELSFFSPLFDESPAGDCDAVFLPGGYPELYPDRIASARRFHAGMHAAASRGARIYGECGGYMVLGQALTGSDGRPHAMLGLLPVVTSFENPKLHLGYRELLSLGSRPFRGRFAGHEFHYAELSESQEAESLFEAWDADGQRLGPVGHVAGSVIGSFAHLICARSR